MWKQKTTGQTYSIRSWQILLIGSLIPGVILLICYVHSRIWPFGSRTILEGDELHQYLPFLTELRRRLIGGRGVTDLFYSFGVGLGHNFLTTIAYYASSPLNILMILIPESSVCDFITWMMLVKTSLCGGIMAWYLHKHEQGCENALSNNTGTEGQFVDKSATIERNTKCLHPPGLCFALFSIVFGAVFALSNYLLGYSFNIMWVDTVAVTPFILFGLEQLVHQKRSHFYILSLFYAVWSNYYIGYMVCVFACLYLIYLIVAECDIRYWPVREIAECIARFAVSSLAAGGMAAVLLLPAFLSLRNATSSQPPEGPGIKIYTNAISLFRAHFVDFFPYRTSYDRGAVNIYSGVIVLILLAVFLLDRSIKLRKRMSLAVLLGILLFSFSFSPLNYAWHGFHIETGVPNRFAFLYSILLCKICHEAMCRIYRALVPGTMNEKCLAYEQNMNMNQRHDSKTCWCQASTCGGSPHSEMVQILLKGYI